MSEVPASASVAATPNVGMSRVPEDVEDANSDFGASSPRGSGR